MSTTPRTDAQHGPIVENYGKMVPASFARELEEELARVTAERDNARAQALADRAFQSDNADLSARVAESDRLLAEEIRDGQETDALLAARCAELDAMRARVADLQQRLDNLTA